MAGDNEQVIGAGALKLCASRVVQEGFFAEDHGIHERGLGRGPELMNFADDAGMDARAPQRDAIARESGKGFDVSGLR
jgi:hypothetical protein